MAATGIAQKRNATFGIHHAECQGRIDTGLPPFILSLYHQAGDAVDIPRTSPLYIFASVASQVRAWGIAVVRHHGQRTLRMPGGKVPRESSHGGMAERHDGRIRQFRISADLSQIFQHTPIRFRCTLIRIPHLVPSGRDPNQSQSHAPDGAAERHILKQRLFTHVVVAHHDGFHPMAIVRDVKERPRMPTGLIRNNAGYGHRPLPFGRPPPAYHQN